MKTINLAKYIPLVYQASVTCAFVFLMLCPTMSFADSGKAEPTQIIEEETAKLIGSLEAEDLIYLQPNSCNKHIGSIEAEDI